MDLTGKNGTCEAQIGVHFSSWVAVGRMIIQLKPSCFAPSKASYAFIHRIASTQLNGLGTKV